MYKFFHKRFSTTILFSISTFLITLLTISITLGIYIGLAKLGFNKWWYTPNVISFFFVLFFISFVVGVLLSFIVGRIPMKPIAKLIDAIDTLSSGDYSIRLPKRRLAVYQSLADSFNRLAEELGNTEMLRSDFINDFSHEFKTPIVSIRGFAKLLKNNQLSYEERDEYLNIIIEESGRLAALSNNVLNLNKLERQNIITNSVDINLAELVRRVILLTESKWHKKQLNLDINLQEIHFLCDPALISQLCINLIDNAIKFSEDKTEISILLQQHGNQVLFIVQDHGCGMDETILPNIYNKFYQADSSHSTEGNGLGLSVVTRIVTLYHGKIDVESAPGEGSTFTVSLPLTII